MDDQVIARHLENLNSGFARVEQILPTLATKGAVENLDRGLARVEQILPTLATKEEVNKLDHRLARLEQMLPTLATREELRLAIAPLATKEELREEGERSRRHMTMLIEHQDSKIALLAEHLLSSKRKPPKE